jgi:hypothetical protein
MTRCLQRWWKVPRLTRLLILLVIIAWVSLTDNYLGHRHHSDQDLILLCQSAFFIPYCFNALRRRNPQESLSENL